MGTKYVIKLYWFNLFIFSVLLIFATWKPIGFDRDSEAYLRASKALIFDPRWIEPTFTLISFLTSKIFNSAQSGLFFIYALISLSIKFYALAKLTENYKKVIFTYICFFYLILEVTQIRAAVSTSIFLLAIKDLLDGDKKAYTIKIIFAFLFHYTSILYLVLLGIEKGRINKTLWYLIPILGLLMAPVMNVIGLNLFASLLPSKALAYLELENPATIINPFRIGLLIFFYFMLFHLSKKATSKDILFLKIFGTSIFIYYFLSPLSAVFSVRLSGLFLVILIFLIPNYFDRIKQRFIGNMLTFAIGITILFYSIFIQKIVDFTKFYS